MGTFLPHAEEQPKTRAWNKTLAKKYITEGTQDANGAVTLALFPSIF